MVIHFYAKLAAQARWLSMSLSGLRALLPPAPGVDRSYQNPGAVLNI